MMRVYSIAALCLFILPACAPTVSSADSAVSPAESAVSPADSTGAYKAENGPHRVGVVEDFQLTASGREYPLPVLIRYPQPTGDDPGPFPLVIFSHGAGGSGDAFPDLSEHWASHGYIVVHPTHSDSIKLRRRRGETFRNFRDDLGQIVRNVKLLERRDDVVLILDSLDAIEQAIADDLGEARGKQRSQSSVSATIRIDRGRIAMAGHSAGAMTTQALAGVKFNRARRSYSFGDDRIGAFIVISGQGTTRRAFDETSWSDIHKPMFVITGSKDTTPVSNETPATRRQPYEYAPPGDKYLLFIDGATHSSYAGKRTTRIVGETPPRNIDYITDVVAFGALAFLDAYMKGDSDARRFLESDAITRYPGGKVEYKHK